MKIDLQDIVTRVVPAQPWTEGDKIPWHEPGFSRRMLAEHLSQTHDAASRRFAMVDEQVEWIHRMVLGTAPSRVLDLACGPGLYSNRLARLGHTVHGIDFSPASIPYADAEAKTEGLSATYTLADIRTAEYGADYDFAMLLYGELNVFSPEDALLILTKARKGLRPGGRLLIEPHTFQAVESRGASQPVWRTLTSGLFSERPHLLLEESAWNEERAVATYRWFVIDAGTGAVERHADSMQAYTEAAYGKMAEEAGFTALLKRPDWPLPPSQAEGLVAFIACNG